jgi:hypothetical protein
MVFSIGACAACKAMLVEARLLETRRKVADLFHNTVEIVNLLNTKKGR